MINTKKKSSQLKLCEFAFQLIYQYRLKFLFFYIYILKKEVIPEHFHGRSIQHQLFKSFYDIFFFHNDFLFLNIKLSFAEYFTKLLSTFKLHAPCYFNTCIHTCTFIIISLLESVSHPLTKTLLKNIYIF